MHINSNLFLGNFQKKKKEKLIFIVYQYHTWWFVKILPLTATAKRKCCNEQSLFSLEELQVQVFLVQAELLNTIKTFLKKFQLNTCLVRSKSMLPLPHTKHAQTATLSKSRIKNWVSQNKSSKTIIMLRHPMLSSCAAVH